MPFTVSALLEEEVEGQANLTVNPSLDEPLAGDMNAMVDTLFDQVWLLIDQARILWDWHPSEPDVASLIKALCHYFLTLYRTGIVVEFMERYESYAIVLGLDEQKKFDNLFTELIGKVANWYATFTRAA